jgi:hypothetical protein
LDRRGDVTDLSRLPARFGGGDRSAKPGRHTRAGTYDAVAGPFRGTIHSKKVGNDPRVESKNEGPL